MDIVKPDLAEKHTRMRGDDRRALILTQSTIIFAQQGYHEASTGALARACGVTEPIIYKHFGSKKKLYQAVLNRIGEQFLKRFRDSVEQRANNDLMDCLTYILLDYRTAALADREGMLVLLNAILESNDTEIEQITQAHNREIYTLVYSLLEKAQKQDILSTQLDLSAATWGFLSFLFAINFRVRAHITGQYNEQTIHEINRLWVQALRSG
jgi:AcrR family transcriptional regulator